MHPVEHVLFFSSILIHVVVAASPVHILFHMQHQALTAVTSHAGFENLLVKDRRASSPLERFTTKCTTGISR